MQLTQIRLSGFKSFPDNTTIDVQANIVAVVGPNGCGKSNLIDAVRWVLGESSARQLRGENMQNVIFNGTDNRAPLSRASVELRFNNEDQALAGPWGNYAEIAVKRIITKQGDASYWINNQQVRRKDITDLFLGTGLGARGYAVIEQGMISKIVEAKPDELRSYIDEAAGIAKYKDRKKDTENRLKVTLERLERIEDIKSELASQLSKLSKQAGQARKYQAINRELNDIQNQLLALQLKVSNEKISGFAEKKRAVEKSIQQLSQMIKMLKDDHYENQLKDYAEQENYKNLMGTISNLQNSINKLETELNFNQTEAERKQHAQQDLIENKTKLHELMTNAEVDLGQQQTSLVEKEFALNHLETQLQEFQDVEQQLQAKIESQESIVVDLKTAILTKQQSLKLHEQEIRYEQHNSANLNAKITELNNKIQTKQFIDVSKQKIQHQELLDINNGLAHKLSAIITEKTVQEQLQQSLQENLNGAEQDLTKVKIEINMLEERIKQLEKHHESFWQQFPAITKTALWSMIKIDKQWEAPIVALLGEKLYAQYTATDIFSAKQQNQALGVWINQLQSSEIVNLDALSNDSVVHLIDCKDKNWLPLLVTWLGKVRKIDSLEIALHKQHELKDGEIWLTPQGDCIDRHSVIFQGVLSKDSLLQLNSQLEELEQQREQLEAVQHKFKIELTACLKLLTSLVEQIREEEIYKTELLKKLQNIEQSIFEAETKNTLFKELEQEVCQEIKKYAIELQEIDTKVSDLNAKNEHLTQLLIPDEAKLVQLEKEFLVLQQQSKENKNNFAYLNDEKQGLVAEVIEIKSNIKHLEKSLHEYKQRQDLLSIQQENLAKFELKDLAEIKTQLIELKQKEQNVQIEVKQVEEVSKKNREIRENLTQQIEDFEEQLVILQKNLYEYDLQIQQESIYKNQYLETLQQRKQNIIELMSFNQQNNSNVQQLSAKSSSLSKQLKALGNVNLMALEELAEVEERHQFYTDQVQDVTTAIALLKDAMFEIDTKTKALFKETLEKVNIKLQEFFPILLGGGSAMLRQTTENLLDTGLSFIANPLGKKNSSIQLLSGGEKALTALSLIFSLFSLNPAPFCLLDEVDAPLDDANTQRFCNLVEHMSKTVQFLFISHNQLTMGMAQQLIGVTMQEKGVSRIVSVDVSEALRA